MWRLLTQEPTGLVQAALVFAIGAALSAVLWLPATALAGKIATSMPYANCAPLGHSPEGSRCAIQNGITGFVPPLILAVLIVLLRGVLGRVVRLFTPRLPESGQFLLMPLVATTLFTLTWAAARRVRPDQPGLLPQIFFPAMAGLFTFAVIRWGPSLLRLLDVLVGQRDRIRTPIRMLIAAAVPLFFAIVIAPGQRAPVAARFDQLTVLVGMLSGFIMLAPRIPRPADVDGLDSQPLSGGAVDDELVSIGDPEGSRSTVGASA
jgi:hypothetical protein